jgi:hypothetical protein
MRPKLFFMSGLRDKVASLTELSIYPHVVCANFCILAEKHDTFVPQLGDYDRTHAQAVPLSASSFKRKPEMLKRKRNVEKDDANRR